MGNLINYSVSSLNDDKMRTSGLDSIMRQYNLHGEIVTPMQIKSWNSPFDIEVTQSGVLIYTDSHLDRTVNIKKKKNIKTTIRILE